MKKKNKKRSKHAVQNNDNSNSGSATFSIDLGFTSGAPVSMDNISGKPD